MAQLLGGVPEEERGTSGGSRRFNLGVKDYLGYSKEHRTEEYQQRSLLDAIFPELEGVLESDGWLTDISDVVHDKNDNDPASLKDVAAPGTIIRVTADAQLFDAEYIANVLGGTSVVMDGVSRAASQAAPESPVSKKHSNKPQRGRQSPSFADSGLLEDLVEDFDASLAPGITPDLLRAMIRVSRGMFSKGLHMLVETAGNVGWAATARLQQGGRYLDVEPDILFSRYGLVPQEWTIVGTVGHYSSRPDDRGLQDMNFMNPGGQSVSRTKFVNGLNSLMSLIAGLGFADTPPYPGFSIIPIAVYRLIPKSEPKIAIT